MPKVSAGLLLFRRVPVLEVLLVHPGGPFWAARDLGAWSIPKGEVAEGEDALAAAQREFEEETGLHAEGPFHPLGQVKQKGGKVVSAWACEGDCDPAALHSNDVQMRWPPGSDRVITFLEVDRAAWFAPAEARRRINPAQVALLEALERLLA